MTLTYIFHSGFVLETEQSILVFDYWLDPSGVMEGVLSPTFSPRTSTNIGEPAKKILTCGWPKVAHGLIRPYPYGHLAAQTAAFHGLLRLKGNVSFMRAT